MPKTTQTCLTELLDWERDESTSDLLAVPQAGVDSEDIENPCYHIPPQVCHYCIHHSSAPLKRLEVNTWP